MSRVLITGATTPYGRSLVDALLGDPSIERVIAVGREALGSLPPRADARFTYVSTDLTRTRSLRELMWGEARDATTLVDAAVHRSANATGARAHRLNVDKTRSLLAMAEQHPNITRYVFRSTGAVYQIDARQPDTIDERHPVNFDPAAPQWVRDRVEADLTACTHMGMSSVKIVVLRFAECVAPDMGSQLHDYLTAPVCFRPLGYDPMTNIISLRDMVAATRAALRLEGHGLFNVPGADTLPLSALIRRFGRRALPAPGIAMAPLYRARALVEGSEFRYDLNHWRFHFNGVLSGQRAADELGYRPRHGTHFPEGGVVVGAEKDPIDAQLAERLP